MKLFEGFVSFNVSYSGLYKRKGHGNGEKIKFAFWGVRAPRDKAGKEIGLCPMTPVSISRVSLVTTLRRLYQQTICQMKLCNVTR